MASAVTEYIELADEKVQIVSHRGEADQLICDGCSAELSAGDVVMLTNPPGCGCDVFVHLQCTLQPHNHPAPSAADIEMLKKVWPDEHWD